MRDYPALLLNADYRPLSYFPLSTLPWQTAIKLKYEDVIDVVAEYEDEVHSPSTTVHIPSVVALRRYIQHAHHVPFTRFNVFLRDRFKCQYCGGKFKAHDLTFDHVLPRCDGGETVWDNIVAACFACNMDKDHHRRNPIRRPRKPTAGELLAAQREFPPRYLHDSWMDFLYWDSEIEK